MAKKAIVLVQPVGQSEWAGGPRDGIAKWRKVVSISVKNQFAGLPAQSRLVKGCVHVCTVHVLFDNGGDQLSTVAAHHALSAFFCFVCHDFFTTIDSIAVHRCFSAFIRSRRRFHNAIDEGCEKHKRTAISVEQKEAIVKVVESRTKKSQVAHDFSIVVSMLSTILANHEATSYGHISVNCRAKL